jgi:hypothetical protein
VIRIGEQHPRSVTLPKLGTIRVHDDTRRLRRLLHPAEQIDPDTGLRKVAPLARILFITCSRHGSRWYISLNVRAPTFIQSAATNLASTMTRAGSSAWTAALPRSP